MTLIEVVLLTGLHCVSPVEEARSATIAGKVPCAVVIRMDDRTGEVDFNPPAAATNPQVIAMLVKQPPQDQATLPGEFAEGDGQEAQPAPKPREIEKEKPRKLAVAAKKQRQAKRRDRCGSLRAVWYTRKDGRRKYRCVRAG